MHQIRFRLVPAEIELEKYSIVSYRKNTLGFSLEYTLVILLQ